MLESKKIKNDIISFFAQNENVPYIVGNGVITGLRIGFDESKLEENKGRIATLLYQLGVSEHPLIRLSSLTKLKDGTVWNKVQTMDDFQALDLLIACSDACGFIHNDMNTIQRNVHEIGDVNSMLISKYGRVGIDDETWLQLIRECVINNMYFFTEMETIKNFAISEETPESSVRHK